MAAAEVEVVVVMVERRGGNADWGVLVGLGVLVDLSQWSRRVQQIRRRMNIYIYF